MRLLLLLISGIFTLVLASCATLPENYQQTTSNAYKNTENTTLGRDVATFLTGREYESGFYPLISGVDAFVARTILSEAAERSIDVQYFVWNTDDIGKLLLHYLLTAADRNIRIRLLVDDVTSTPARDRMLAAFDAHKNIEVRLFNVFANRDSHNWELLGDLNRLNYRMHNKSFTVDNQITVVGGRNIGEEYFEADPKHSFGDIDFITIGPLVNDVSQAFDIYWNNPITMPIRAFQFPDSNTDSLKNLQKKLKAHFEAMRSSVYAEKMRHTELTQQLDQGSLNFIWGKGQLLYDQPYKLLSDDNDPLTHLALKLASHFNNTKKELLLVSPYFIPGQPGIQFIEKMREKGVDIKVFTNSLASTNVPAVYAHYSLYREDLLRLGVQLYELKPPIDPQGSKNVEDPPLATMLHAKTFVFDRKKTFIGSFNLDPRSDYINTEIGVVIESEQIAQLIGNLFDEVVKQHAFKLEWKEVAQTTEDDAPNRYTVEWVTSENGNETRYSEEPYTTGWQRFQMWFLSLLPIEEHL